MSSTMMNGNTQKQGKIPVNTVTSRYLIEKWYPVLPDSSSSSSKEKEHPSLRVKCKYQSVDILPLRCYKSFLQYVKDQYGPLSECLESVLSVKAKEDLASAHGDEKLTFRGNSNSYQGYGSISEADRTEYLHATLGPFIEQFQGSEDLYDCEIDPMKLPAGTNLSKNQQNLRMAVDTVWKGYHAFTLHLSPWN
ncbi:putative Ras GTPase-activating protein [Orchesella cincta]|uniref:Putative Ras GTPase-activating protein n=1 Tax=Orchesella cincta TaxID=48709 RepID=A0A1D2M3H1_ORCCI|nr:putative Ras GTPase-activating protein [Orchesella cincta]